MAKGSVLTPKAEETHGKRQCPYPEDDLGLAVGGGREVRNCGIRKGSERAVKHTRKGRGRQ